MAIVCWDGSLKVGVDIVDAQHKYLFEIINSMHAKLARGDAALARGDAALALADALDSMRTYARFHFETEEGLLGLHGYPGLAAHKAQHREFLSALEGFASAEPTTALAHQILGYLLTWLSGHIQTEDGRYAPFLAEQGVS